MRAEVCATLSAVFPLVVIAVVSSRPLLHLRLRRGRVYRWSVQLAIICSLVGLVVVVVGQQLGGLSAVASVPVWSLFGVDVVCLGLTVVIAAVTSELVEDADASTTTSTSPLTDGAGDA